MWYKEMVLLLRHVINDNDAPQEFSDARLESLLLSSAQLTLGVLDFTVSYTIDVVSGTIDPDPTESPRDNGFINLVVLKAACLLATGEFRRDGGKGMMVKDGPSTIDTRSLAQSRKELMTDLCKAYQEAELQYRLGNSKAGEAIIGPHRADIIAHGGIFTDRDRPEFR